MVTRRRANRRDGEVEVLLAWELREGDNVVDHGAVVSVHRDPVARTVRIATPAATAELPEDGTVAVIRS